MRCCVVLLLVGCAGEGQNGSAGEDGLAGATGPTGATGPIGPPGGGFRWHAADGTPVGYGSPPVLVDGSGYLWPLDIETGGVDTDGLLMPSFYRYAYTTDDCGGIEYAFTLAAPRIVMSGAAHEEPGVFYVRPDDLALQPVRVLSARNSLQDPCYDADTTIDAIPFSEMITVTPPSSPWPGPLHPEVAL